MENNVLHLSDLLEKKIHELEIMNKQLKERIKRDSGMTDEELEKVKAELKELGYI